MSVSEWIGFGIGALLVGLLVSALLWMSGQSTGLGRKKLTGVLTRIWVAMAGCIAGLLWVRSQVGGELWDYNAAQAALTARPIGGESLLWLLLGLVWTVACLVVAIRAAAVVTRRPLDPRPATDETRE